MGNHHSSAPGLHRASSSTHRDVVERLGLSAITSGLSLDDTEKIWNTYHTNDTTFIDFQEWTALAKDLVFFFKFSCGKDRLKRQCMS